ncbi:MAG: alkaline shock response membrane anchor protein AmaP [Selenomonadaceae bacterium]|nr:alkaline shock response membrane anchor protein AmaP [Selenomonadaceae bacterium]
MGIISRLLLFLYVLAVMAVSAVCGGVCLKLIPAKVWQNVLNDLVTREETIMVIGAMLVASLCLLGVVFSRKKNIEDEPADDVLLQKGDSGEVLVSLEAVMNVIERSALTVNGVREVHSDVYKGPGPSPIKVKMSVTLSQGYSAPAVSSKITSVVNDALRVAFEFTDVPIKLKVKEITNAVAERGKRVV